MANNIHVDVLFRLDKAEKALKKLEGKSAKSGKKAGKELSKGFSEQVSIGIGSIAKQAIGLSLAFRAVGKAVQFANESFNDFRKFGKGLAEVNTLLPKNQKLTQASINTLQDFSVQFGSSAQSQAKAFYNVVSAGVKGTAKQLQTLSIANKAAVAGLVDIDSSASVLVSSVNAYAKSGLTAQRASDILFATVREGQTTFGELASSLGNTTSIAANAGVKYEELAGSLAFVTKSGIKTDVAVTGLRQVFASIIKPSKEASDEAKRLGLEFNKSAIQSKGFAGFLKSVQVATKGNEQSLAKLFGNIRALAPVLNIVNGNFKDFERILNATKNSVGDTSKAFDIMQGSLDIQISQLDQEFSLFGRNLLSLVAPAITEVVSKLRTVGAAINDAIGNKSKTRAQEIGDELVTLSEKIANVKSTLKQFKSNSFLDKIGTFFRTNNPDKSITKLENRLSSFLSQSKKLLAEKKAINEAEASSSDEKVKKIIAGDEKVALSAQGLAEKLKNIGLTRIQQLESQRDAKLAILNQLLETEPQLEGEILSRIAVVQGTFATQEKALLDQRVLNAQASTQGIADAFKVLGKNTKITAGQIAKTTNNVLAAGIGNAFTSVGASIRNGGDALASFADAVEKTFGNLASSIGDFYIKDGIAKVAGGFPGGAAEIAGGSALKLLGGLLGGGSSGGGGGSTSSGASGANKANENLVTPQAIERKTSSQVNITVQGSLVQQEELGAFIQNTLNEVNQKNGIIQVNSRVA